MRRKAGKPVRISEDGTQVWLTWNAKYSHYRYVRVAYDLDDENKIVKARLEGLNRKGKWRRVKAKNGWKEGTEAPVMQIPADNGFSWGTPTLALFPQHTLS